MPMTDLPAIDSSRRLPGPNRLFDRAGVIIEGCVTGDPAALVAGWRRHVGRMLEDLGLSDSTLAVITHAGGVSLGFSAPVDILLFSTLFILRLVIRIYMFVMWGRFILDWVRVFNPAPTATTVEIDRDEAPARGWLIDLRGRPLERFEGSFALRSAGIATARLDA